MAVETDDLGPGWDGVQPPQKGGGQRTNTVSLFMKLDPRPEPYHVRLTCTPIMFRKHKWAFRSLKQWPISPATDKSEKDADIAWRDGKFMPVVRFAAFVFDRDSDNRLRILEESGDVFGPIGNHAHATNVNAASPTKGWDWLILVTETIDSNGKKNRTYAVTIDTSKNGPTPFTEAEIKALENPKFQRSELETRYFVKSTSEEIAELWEQLPAASRVNKPNDGGKGTGSNDTKPVTSHATKPVAKSAAEPPAEKPIVQASVAPATAPVNQTPVVAPPAKAEAPVEEVKDDSFLADPADGAADGDDDQPPARLF